MPTDTPNRPTTDSDSRTRQPLERQLLIDILFVFASAILACFASILLPLVVALGVLTVVRGLLVAADRIVAGGGGAARVDHQR